MPKYQFFTGVNNITDKHYFDLQGQVFVKQSDNGNITFNDIAISKGDLFLEQLQSSLLKDENKTKLTNNFNALIKSDERFSIIPIYKELYFHTLRISNALTDNDSLRKDAFAFAFDEIYQLINRDIAEFLNNPKDKNGKEINDVKVEDLNHFIAQKRLAYAAYTESMVASYLALSPGYMFPKDSEIKDRLLHQTIGAITVESDNQITGLKTKVTGVENSSHSKGKKPPAFIKIEQSKSDGTLVQTQYRVPSLKAYKNSNGKTISIKEQIQQAITDFNIPETNPIIYNLLTSIPIGIDSCDQQKSAEAIFKGMHQYNSEKLSNDATDANENEKAKKLFYVMNLPINQHTHSLSYDKFNDAAKEALFLADLAILIQWKPIYQQMQKRN